MAAWPTCEHHRLHCDRHHPERSRDRSGRRATRRDAPRRRRPPAPRRSRRGQDRLRSRARRRARRRSVGGQLPDVHDRAVVSRRGAHPRPRRPVPPHAGRSRRRGARRPAGAGHGAGGGVGRTVDGSPAGCDRRAARTRRRARADGDREPPTSQGPSADQPSAVGVQPSAFGVRRSAFGAYSPSFRTIFFRAVSSAHRVAEVRDEIRRRERHLPFGRFREIAGRAVQVDGELARGLGVEQLRRARRRSCRSARRRCRRSPCPGCRSG